MSGNIMSQVLTVRYVLAFLLLETRKVATRTTSDRALMKVSGSLGLCVSIYAAQCSTELEFECMFTF